MITPAPQVDSFGNLNVHVREDLHIPIRGGTGYADIGARTMVIEFLAPDTGKVVFTKTIAANPMVATEKLLSVTKEEFAKIEDASKFAVIDKTGSSKVVWSGVYRKVQ